MPNTCIFWPYKLVSMRFGWNRFHTNGNIVETNNFTPRQYIYNTDVNEWSVVAASIAFRTYMIQLFWRIARSASWLDLQLEINNENRLKMKYCNKRGDFNFHNWSLQRKRKKIYHLVGTIPQKINKIVVRVQSVIPNTPIKEGLR